MLDAIAQAAGTTRGCWASSGVYANGERQAGELGPWLRVVQGIRSGDLELGIQELEAPTTVAAGLPPRSYPLAVLTTLCANNEACLVTPETQLERRALGVVTQAVADDGVIVASADDFAVVELVRHRDVECMLYALSRDNPALQRHLDAGGAGAWVEDGHIRLGTNAHFDDVLNAHAIPATLEGKLIFQIQNALAATCAATLLGFDYSMISEALATFAPDPARQPGGCNIVHYGGATILVDAPTQIWPLRMLARGIRHQPRRRTIVVSSTFPHLRLEDIADAGRVLGNLGALVLIDIHGADAARLDALKEGIASAATPAVVLPMSGELQAIDHLLNVIGSGDVGLILVSDPESALGHLWPAPAISVSSRRPTQEKRAS